MPIYEYKCSRCGHEFEELVFSRDETPPCPDCGSKDVERLMSACAVQTDGDSPGLGPMPRANSGCGGSSGG